MEAFQTKRVYGIGNRWRLEFGDLATERANLMTVAVIVITSLVFRVILKAMAHDQTQLHEQFQGIIQRCPADWKPQLAAQFVAQLLKREMTFYAINGIEDGKALRSLTKSVLFQVAGQYCIDCFLDVFFHFMGQHSLKPHKITTFSSETGNNYLKKF